MGERIRRVTGIVNGTTNYVLTRMTEERCSFADAVAEAQELGYAEPDPTADIDGFDAAAKAAIIASIAFGARVVAGDVSREGITQRHRRRHRRRGRARLRREAARGHRGARRRGERARAPGDGAARPSARVGARLVQRGVHRGRGGRPADAARPRRRRRARPSSALLGDLIDAAKNLHSGARGATIGALERRPIRPIDETSSQFYVSLDAADRPGVLATIAGVFGEHEVSIQSMQQKGQGDDARLIFVTHVAREADVSRRRSATCAISTRSSSVGSVLRVVGGEE